MHRSQDNECLRCLGICACACGVHINSLAFTLVEKEGVDKFDF